MDADKTLRGKAWWDLHKNATSYIDQILEVKPHETIAVRPLTFHLKNHSSQTNKTRGTPLKKQGRTHKSSFSVPVLAYQQEFIYVSFVRTQDIV